MSSESHICPLQYDLSRRISWTVPASVTIEKIENYAFSSFPAFDIHVSGKTQTDLLFVLERLQWELDFMAQQIKKA